MNAGHFPPPKRIGVLIHGAILAALFAAAALSFIALTRVEAGSDFLLALLALLVAFMLIPFFAYRAYSLWRADYRLDRDSLTLVWGLRVEQIPLNDVEFIRPAEDLVAPLKPPAFSMPGALLGLRRHPDLGMVEFLASDKKKILLAATARRVFAISPDRRAEFAQAFARAVEMGSLTPAEVKSVYPSFVVAQAWQNGAARYFWLTALFLNVGLFVWASLAIPASPRVILGPLQESVSSSQLIIFPLASLLLSAAGWIAGLYFYRRKRERPLAFILWASTMLTGLLFLLAALFVTAAPG